VSRRLVVDRFVICASPSYLAERGRPERPDDFAGHAGIIYLYQTREAPWQMRDAQGQLKELRIERRLRFDDIQAIADAALAGAGIARLPRWLVAPYLRSGQLVLLADTEGSMAIEIHALWPHTRYMPSKTRAAVDALAAEIPAMLNVEWGQN
jgi:DNA-binding transcriptional LysR family regulator